MKAGVAFGRVSLVGAVTIGRLVGTLVFFALVARAAGPDRFAAFGYWYAVSVMAAALTEYGFAQQVLSQLPAQPDRAARESLVDSVMGAKLWLLLLAGAVTSAVGLVAADTMDERLFAVLLVAAALAGSLNELLSMMLRAAGAFRWDAWSSVLLGLGASLAAGAVVFVTGSLVASAATLLALRLAGLGLQVALMHAASGVRPSLRVRIDDARRVWSGMRSGLGHGLDNLAIQLMLNADVLACRLFLDPIQAGLYLSANRLSHAAHAGFPVLASVFLPAIVAGRDRGGAMRWLVLASLAVALLWNALMWTLGEPLAMRLFGAGFEGSGALLGPMAIAVGLRYATLAPAVRLVVNGRLAAKATGAFVGIAGLAAALAWQHSGSGGVDAAGLVFALILANTLQAAWLLLLASRRRSSAPPLQQGTAI